MPIISAQWRKARKPYPCGRPDCDQRIRPREMYWQGRGRRVCLLCALEEQGAAPWSKREETER